MQSHPLFIADGFFKVFQTIILKIPGIHGQTYYLLIYFLQMM